MVFDDGRSGTMARGTMAQAQSTSACTACLDPRAIEVTVEDDPAELWKLRDEWNDLLRRSETSTAFQALEWILPWWEAFGSGARSLVLLARVGGVLVGAAPLMISTRQLFGRKRRLVEFIAVRASDYADFIVGPDKEVILPALLKQLLVCGAAWDLLYLSNMPEESSTLRQVAVFFARHGYPLVERFDYECPTYRFGDLEADRRLVRKKSLKRHFNHFQKTGCLEFRRCRTADDLLTFLDPFFEQHIARRALTDVPSIFHDPRHRAFHRRAALALLPTGWLDFSVVLHDGRPIAFHYGFDYNDKLMWYKPSFDPTLASRSPGEVLLKYLFEDALERELREFDFGIGDEPFKYRFANHTRRTAAVQVYRAAPAYYLDRTLLDLRARLKQSPSLMRLILRPGRQFSRRISGSHLEGRLEMPDHKSGLARLIKQIIQRLDR